MKGIVLPTRVKPRSVEECIDFVGSCYSYNHRISYRPVTKQEAWECYIAGRCIWFSDDKNIDRSFQVESITKNEFHKLGFDRARFTFSDLVREIRQMFPPACIIYMAVQI